MPNHIINDCQPVYEADGRPATSMVLTCAQCGREYAVPPSLSKRKYCSWACRVAEPRRHRTRERVVWTCSECGLERLQQPSEMYRKFCSLACRDKNRRIPVEQRAVTVTVCGCCGVELVVPNARLKNGRGKFCSRSCAMTGRPVVKRSAVADEAIELFSTLGVLAIAEHRVGRWSIDLALPIQMVAVELDGVYWHSLPAMVDRDVRKTADLERRGWTVVRVPIGKYATPATLAHDISVAVAPHLTRKNRRPRHARAQTMARPVARDPQQQLEFA
jgi:hypothetical protein